MEEFPYPDEAAPQPRFTVVRWRTGYDMGQVDHLVSRVRDRSLTRDELLGVRLVTGRFRETYARDEVDAWRARAATRLPM